MYVHREAAPLNPGLWREQDLWSRREEPDVRAELAGRYMDFAKSVALRYAGTAEMTDDLIQVANLGLMNAIERFDPEAGTPFVAFASPTINGELKRHFRDRVSTVHLPRSIYERVGKIESAVSSLRAELGREPSTADIAEATSCTDEEVDEAWAGVSARHPKQLTADRGDEEEGIVEEHIGFEDDSFEKSESRMVARDLIRKLSREDRRIIGLRFREELSQSEIADRLGCSQMSISRKLSKILGGLNDKVEGSYRDKACS